MLLCRTSPEGIGALCGAMLLANIFLGTSNSSTVQPVVGQQRSIMYRCLPHTCHLRVHRDLRVYRGLHVYRDLRVYRDLLLYRDLCLVTACRCRAATKHHV